MATLAQDAMLGDRYRLSGRIAIGGMGEVWRAEDTLLHRAVAVKVLKTELSVDPTFLERFRNEARSAAAFSHAGIAGVFDYGETEAAEDEPPTAYLVMELVEGEPLSAILAREGRLTVARTMDYVWQAAAALQVAHRTGMVHRDIKPGNLLIAADGQVKITDFGIARAGSTVRHTQAGMVVGTAQYFSPEQAEGRVVGPASDVYSLGVVAYECLSGQLPFTADSPVTVAVMQIRNVPPPLPMDVPPPVRAVVERAMAKDARWRYPNGGELASAIEAAKQGHIPPPPVAAPTGPPMPVPSPAIAPGPVPTPGPALTPRAVLGPPPVGPRRRRIALVLGVVATLVAAGIVIWLLVDRGSHRNAGAAHSDLAAAKATPTPSAAAKTPTPSRARRSAPANGGVVVDPNRFVGHQVGEALQWLRDQGLRATVAKQAEGAPKDGTVKALMTASGHVLRAPTLLPPGSQVRLVAPDTHPESTASHSANHHIVAGLHGLVDLTPPSSEQQGNR